MVLGISMQFIPTRVGAVVTPPVERIGGLLGAGVIGFLIFGEGGAAAKAKTTGNEFADLNNNGSFKTLLNQVAGGSLNTLDILK